MIPYKNSILNSNYGKSILFIIRDIFTLSSQSSNQDFVVFSQEVQATIPRNEGGNFLGVLLQHNSDTLSDGRVWLDYDKSEIYFI